MLFGDNHDQSSNINYYNGLLFNVHPNDAGNYAMAKIIYMRSKALGYW